MDEKAAVQIDTGDLILALEGLMRSQTERSSPDETSASIELCNNLVLYPRICYDGNLHEKNKTRLQSLIAQVSTLIPDAETKDLFLSKFQPIELDSNTESTIVLKSGIHAIQYLPALAPLVSFLESTTNPMYESNPFSNLDRFWKLFSLPVAPNESAIESFIHDRSIRGGRFLWALLRNVECRPLIENYLNEEPNKRIGRLRALFTRYRLCFAVNRGQHVQTTTEEFTRGLYYHPTRYRQKFLTEFTRSVYKVWKEKQYSSWKESIEPLLAQEHYIGGTAYLEYVTGGVISERDSYIPLLVNRVLKQLAEKHQLTRSDLLRGCLELSQDEIVLRMWNALEVYDGLSKRDKKECLKQMCEYTRSPSDPLAAAKEIVEETLSNVPEKGIKGAVRSAIVDSLSLKRHAASVLGQAVDGLLQKLEAMATIKEVFGTWLQEN